MSKLGPLLEIRFAGQAINRGRVPVTHLVSFLSSWRKVLQRTGRVLRGEAKSVRRGQPPQDLKAELEFDTVSLTGEGEAAILGLERRLENASFPEMDFGLKVLQLAIGGLKELDGRDPDQALPDGLDAGVLRAWRDAGVLLGQGIDAIEFTLNDTDGPVKTALTPALHAGIRERLTQAQINILKIQGRLLMVDFTGNETRCRVHPADGEPIVCRVDEEQKEAVLSNMLQDVLITGEVHQDPATGKISSISIQDIERLDKPTAAPAQQAQASPNLLDIPEPKD